MKKKQKQKLSNEEVTPDDYRERTYLSTAESAVYLKCDVKTIRRLIRLGEVQSKKSCSGQHRISLEDLKKYENIPPVELLSDVFTNHGQSGEPVSSNILEINGTKQTVFCSDSRDLSNLPDGSVNLMVTSPPYFNAKMYSEGMKDDLGNIHDMDEWFAEIEKTWAEVYRVLQPGRKAFINIMNLPVRYNKTFRTLNLVGKTIDVMEKIGFIFKRDIIWHKTNGVKAHFGTYPYPGGILINNMHEFILEFEKPAPLYYKKYAHLTEEQKNASLLDKDFWLSLKNSDVWLMKPEKSGDRRNHIAPFPYELPYRIIKAYSFIGETVLDPFGGSLVALKAAADLGRNGIAYEINPAIVEKSIRKLESVDF
jgi:excisionase family DNA binding protein